VQSHNGDLRMAIFLIDYSVGDYCTPRGSSNNLAVVCVVRKSIGVRVAAEESVLVLTPSLRWSIELSYEDFHFNCTVN
jgi:hypothetical protein